MLSGSSRTVGRSVFVCPFTRSSFLFSSGSCSGEDSFARKLKSWQQPGFIDLGRLVAFFAPLPAYTLQHHHFSFVGVNDPVLLDAELQVLLRFFLVVTMLGFRGSHFNDDFWNPHIPDVSFSRWWRLINSNIRMSLRFESGQRNFAFPSAGNAINLPRVR